MSDGYINWDRVGESNSGLSLPESCQDRKSPLGDNPMLKFASRDGERYERYLIEMAHGGDCDGVVPRWPGQEV